MKLLHWPSEKSLGREVKKSNPVVTAAIAAFVMCVLIWVPLGWWIWRHFNGK